MSVGRKEKKYRNVLVVCLSLFCRSYSNLANELRFRFKKRLFFPPETHDDWRLVTDVLEHDIQSIRCIRCDMTINKPKYSRMSKIVYIYLDVVTTGAP